MPAGGARDTAPVTFTCASNSSVTAVAAKNASDIPDRNKDGLPDFPPVPAYDLINQPTPDILASAETHDRDSIHRRGHSSAAQ